MFAGDVGPWLVSVLAMGVATVTVRPAAACGGGTVSTASTRLSSDTQRVFLSVRDGQTDVITQVVVPETTSDYGVLLPVEGEPRFDPDPVDSEELESFDRITAPRVYVESHDSGGGGCGCPFATGGTPKGISGGDDALDVEVTEIDIGPVTAVSLTADVGDAVNGWLSDNGFELSAEAQDRVAEYSGPGRYFVAVRRNDEAAPGGPTSVGVHFTLDGDQRLLPLRFMWIGAADTVALTVFIGATEASAPAAPFEALTLEDLDAGTLRREGYADAVASAITERDGRALVIEGIYSGAELRDVGTELDQMFDADQVVTRLSTILPKETLTEDVVLNEPFSDSVPSTRVVHTRALDTGLRFGAAVALIGAAFRRRRRSVAR